MKLIINGKTENIENIATVTDLVEYLAGDLPKFFAVEKNKKIIYRENYPQEPLIEGDEVEIVIFAGGG